MLLCNVVIMKEIQIKRVTLNCLNCFEGGGGCCVVTCPRQLTQIESASVPLSGLTIVTDGCYPTCKLITDSRK